MLEINKQLYNDLMVDLYQTTWDLTAQIPEGKISTYGQIARALGDIRAARAVGIMEHANPRPIVVPCHRVVYSHGGLGGYGAPEGLTKKISLLNSEGVKIKAGKIVDFENVLFTDFSLPGKPPLKKIKEQQKKLAKNVLINDIKPDSLIKSIAGIDCSYTAEDGFGACVVLDLNSFEVLEQITIRKKIKFPYIPTYLSYLELPLAVQLIEKLNSIPNAVLFDGNGVLHPDGLGLAAHGGLILGLPTFGVAKKLLCGTLEKSTVSPGTNTEVKLDNRRIGFGYRPATSKKRLVYASPGHLMSFDTALKLTKKLCKTKIPEPIRLAHTLALGLRRNNM